MNTFGKKFRITTFGESHGAGIGVVIDGCPPGVAWDTDFIQTQLSRRRPAQSAIVSQRDESDGFELLSGVFEGYTTGTPICLWIPNKDAKSQDYSHLAEAFRPSHADFTYHQKYAGFRDYKGGGRASARETAARVAAGAVAQLLLKPLGIEIVAYVSQVGRVSLDKNYQDLDFSLIETNPVRCPDPQKAQEMETLIREVRKNGDSVGGVVFCVLKGVPAGWGEPLFDKLSAQLGKAMLSIPACKGFDIGSGFEAARMLGSEHNDIFYPNPETQKISTYTNFSGGIQGGISNGMDIYFRAAFKPVATILRTQPSVDIHAQPIQLPAKGRHDPCVLPRAVPIVEAMAALVLADMYLRAK